MLGSAHTHPHLRSAVAMAIGAASVALAAQLSVPVWGSPVPQSLQTLAVLIVGGLLGLRVGAASVVLYLLLGAAGLPVFADGASGFRHLVGPTSGYLIGFVCAAAFAGYWTKRFPHRVVIIFIVMLLAHVIIVALGWSRLALLIGPAEALARGVVPFVWGGCVKSFVATAVVMIARAYK